MGYFDSPRPRCFGHRGAAALCPENTLVSFAKALEDGATILELDVHASRDGHVVVIHDGELERTTDGAGPVSARSLAELRCLDAGYRYTTDDGRTPYRGCGVRIPTLAEVLERFPGVPLNVEIKQHAPAIEAEVVALLDRFDACERVLLAASDHRIMERIRACAADLITGASALEVADFVTRAATDEPSSIDLQGRALQVPPTHQGIEIVTPQIIERAHAHGLEVHVWTINDEDQMHALLDLGVDGLMSDDPGRLCRVLEDRAHR